MLQKAAARLLAAPPASYQDFCAEHNFWLDDHALFMAVKAQQGQAGLDQWPDALRTRQPQAIAQAKHELAGEIAYHKAVQFLFYQQWTALKAYANRQGVKLIGDIPIYVSPDSSDLWTRPDLLPDRAALSRLTHVAGAARRMHLLPTVSCGATPYTIGPATRRRALPGGSAGCATPPPSTMSCASTTSAGLRATSLFHPAVLVHRDIGNLAPAMHFCRPCSRSWAAGISLRRTWVF